MAENAKFKINIREARKNIFEDFCETLKESTKIWFGVIRLVITLSSSLLLLSIAVTDKFFSINGQLIQLPRSLIYAWCALFLSIIFGIVAELDGSIFYGKQGKEIENTLRGFDSALAKGEQEYICETNDKTRYMVALPIFWGALSLNMFILAIIFLCAALLVRIFPIFNPWLMIGTSSFLLLLLNIYLLNKRAK